ncbi:MAG TPA: hypothetical protein VJ673_00995 [Aromatoleum sp.]|uniref:hypothetical protein n=1 Tax=Aromatoleum sp. TaxID=2307007 RepID=UPI002B4684CF|nr:hypothetical protein [Aromatoleum sp.]HJV24223.1 hypothetical protein [Aromatoleum sp.]
MLRRTRRFAVRPTALAVALLLGACATPPTQRVPVPTPSVKPDSGPPIEPEERPTETHGRLKPMPIHPLSIKTDCRFKDEVGYSASTVLDISYSQVNAFAATVDVPKHGSCHFDLADFEQIHKDTHVELHAKDGCTVRVWEQGPKVTVAFSECANRCAKGTFDYVWPIILDRPSGRCY